MYPGWSGGVPSPITQESIIDQTCQRPDVPRKADGISPSKSTSRPSTAEIDERGDAGNRTQVEGFAGPCLNHSATSPTDRRTERELRA